jgi:hypothetical protein
MRVITEAQLLERKRALRAARRDLRRQDREYAAEQRVVEGWLAQLVDVAPAADAPPPAEAPDNGSPTTTEELTPAGEVTASRLPSTATLQSSTVFIRRPASGDSPVSKVQIPVLERVTAQPGILRVDLQREVASQVGSSVPSVRESVRRMLSAKKLREEEGRLYPVGDAGVGSE